MAFPAWLPYFWKMHGLFRERQSLKCEGKVMSSHDNHTQNDEDTEAL